MLSKSRIFLLALILLFCFTQVGFSSYAELVGKWVRLKGSQDYLAVSKHEKTCEWVITALDSKDQDYFKSLLTSYDVMVIKNHTPAILLEVKSFEKKAKITILSGLHKGYIGWIPTEWIDLEEERPSIPDYY